MDRNMIGDPYVFTSSVCISLIDSIKRDITPQKTLHLEKHHFDLLRGYLVLLSQWDGRTSNIRLSLSSSSPPFIFMLKNSTIHDTSFILSRSLGDSSIVNSTLNLLLPS